MNFWTCRGWKSLRSSFLLEESLFYHASDLFCTDLVISNSLKIQQIIYTGIFIAGIYCKVFPAPTPLSMFPILSPSKSLWKSLIFLLPWFVFMGTGVSADLWHAQSRRSREAELVWAGSRYTVTSGNAVMAEERWAELCHVCMEGYFGRSPCGWEMSPILAKGLLH